MPTQYLYIPNLLCKFRRKLSLCVILSYSKYFTDFVLILTQGHIFVDFLVKEEEGEGRKEGEGEQLRNREL